MAQSQRPVQVLAARISELAEQVRLVRMASYLFMIFLIILAIFVILSLVYADSYDPTRLFSSSDRTFSFAGKPLSVMLVSETDNYLWSDMIDNGSVFVSGRSLINVRPDGPVTLVSEDGTSRTVDGPLAITTSQGDASITVSFLDPAHTEYYNNTHLYFNQSRILFDHRGANYNMILMSEPGSFKSYDNQFIAIDGGVPIYSFLNYVRLSGGRFLVNESGKVYPFEGSLYYPGTIEVMTPDTMSTFIPTNETENLIAASRIVLINTDGSLVIGGKEYECHGADNLNISSAGPAGSAGMIKMGKFQALGHVNSLVFRGQEYAAQPIKNFFRDGYFTIATGGLTALLALLFRQFLADFRRR
jgi:hypothetical protein